VSVLSSFCPRKSLVPFQSLFLYSGLMSESCMLSTHMLVSPIFFIDAFAIFGLGIRSYTSNYSYSFRYISLLSSSHLHIPST
jgi:hypothetical protein